MIDLSAMGSPNVVKIYIALEETEFPYIVPVDVFGEEQCKPQFLKPSPNAKVPAITDHDGPGRQVVHAPAVPRRSELFDRRPAPLWRKAGLEALAL